jgi:hypothetical protein
MIIRLQNKILNIIKMKNILIVGGSKGIGNAILLQQIRKQSRNQHKQKCPDVSHDNLTLFIRRVLKDELPNRQHRHLIYCPGSINLKPIAA